MITDKKDTNLLKNTKLNGLKKLKKPQLTANLLLSSEMENVLKLSCIISIISLKMLDNLLNLNHLFYHKCHKLITVMKKFCLNTTKNTPKSIQPKEVVETVIKTKEVMPTEPAGQNGTMMLLIQELPSELILSGLTLLLPTIDQLPLEQLLMSNTLTHWSLNHFLMENANWNSSIVLLSLLMSHVPNYLLDPKLICITLIINGVVFLILTEQLPQLHITSWISWKITESVKDILVLITPDQSTIILIQLM